MKDKLLNGFNNGLNTADGIGGKPSPSEYRTKMNDKLLPCPFCGGEADTDNHYAKCSNPDCIVGVFGRSISIEAWNTRHSEPDADGLDECNGGHSWEIRGEENMDRYWRSKIQKQIDQLPDGTKVVTVPTDEGGWTEVDVTQYVVDSLESLLSDPKLADRTDPVQYNNGLPCLGGTRQSRNDMRWAEQPQPTEADGWVKCSERLPEKDIPKLLVWFNDTFHEAFYLRKLFRMDGEKNSYDVTDIVCYWKLINPPKK